MSSYEYRAKRPIDLLLSSIALIVLSPFLALTSLGVLIFLGRPIIYKSIRAGKHGKPFIMYKFRSMTNAKDDKGRLLSDELRLKSFGILLRKSSMDELPELVNVLVGQMSLVGPRPLPMEYVERYSGQQAQRLNVRPGLTGLAQVSGRNKLTWTEKFHLDVEYLNNLNLMNDLKIISRTIKQVVIPGEVNHEGFATAPEFIGEPRDQ